MACTASGTGCLCFVLFEGGLVFLSLLTGFSLLLGSSFLRCKRVVSIYHCCFGLFYLVVDSWSEEIIAK